MMRSCWVAAASSCRRRHPRFLVATGGGAAAISRRTKCSLLLAGRQRRYYNTRWEGCPSLLSANQRLLHSTTAPSAAPRAPAAAPASAAAAASPTPTATISTTIAFDEHHRRNPFSSCWWWPAAAAAAAVATATTLSIPYSGGDLSSTAAVAYCEEQEQAAADFSTSTDCTSEEKAKQGVSEEKDEDPYDNLPDDDEETDCTICQTFRQGPCRTQWRKLERCFKDHESGSGKSNAGEACMKYFMPHQECLSNYTNLYQLISLELKQELVSDTEKAVRNHERRQFSDDDDENATTASDSNNDSSNSNNIVQIDWTAWKDFCDKVGPSFSQSIPMMLPPPAVDQTTTEKAKTKPALWKRLPPDTDPVLVPTPVTIPEFVVGDDNSDRRTMLLKFSYAIDQDGFAVGMQYNSKYGDLLETARKRKDEKDNKTTTGGCGIPAAEDETAQPTATSDDPAAPSPSEAEKHEEDDGAAGVKPLDVYLVPGETRSIQICAMYTEHPLEAPPDKDLLDVLLYKSRYYELPVSHVGKDKQPSS